MPLPGENEKWLTKKRKKHQYWQVKNFLNGLKLKFKEENKETDFYTIYVPLFGIKIRFGENNDTSDYGWRVFILDKARLEEEPDYFREDMMWYLVEKGYLAYIRDIELGTQNRIYNHIVLDAGWGQKIIEKRIELCGALPEHTFMKKRMEELKRFSMNKIISYCPGIFDYLM